MAEKKDVIDDTVQARDARIGELEQQLDKLTKRFERLLAIFKDVRLDQDADIRARIETV